MNRFISAKPILAAAIAFGSLAAATAAHARTDVQLSIGVPGVYVQPAPVYVQPQPVYVQPRPVYVQPQPVYVQPQGYYYGGDRHEHRGWGEGRWERRHGAWGDADGDGVPNRYDRAPGNPYRR